MAKLVQNSVHFTSLAGLFAMWCFPLSTVDSVFLRCSRFLLLVTLTCKETVDIFPIDDEFQMQGKAIEIQKGASIFPPIKGISDGYSSRNRRSCVIEHGYSECASFGA